MDISAIAPGKIVLLGEYAVLEGWPALAMAVNRTVCCDIKKGPAGPSTVSTPSFGLPPARFSFDQDGTFRWQDGRHHHYDLVQSVATAVSRYQSLRPLSQTGLDICLDSSALFHAGNDGQLTKLGLGSSAALATALAWCIVHCIDRTEWSDEIWMTVLMEAHRDFQKSQGSGIDVAASFHGGIIEYQRLNGRPCARRVTLPAEVQLVFVWSGQSVSTPGLLQVLCAWRQRHSQDYQAIIDELGNTVTESVTAAANGNSIDFVGHSGRFAQVLAELGERSGLELFGAAHLELLAMAKKSGLVYKPCGAGGGDLGVAMGVDIDDTRRFIDLIKNSRFQMIDITPSCEGVRTIRSQ